MDTKRELKTWPFEPEENPWDWYVYIYLDLGIISSQMEVHIPYMEIMEPMGTWNETKNWNTYLSSLGPSGLKRSGSVSGKLSIHPTTVRVVNQIVISKGSNGNEVNLLLLSILNAILGRILLLFTTIWGFPTTPAGAEPKPPPRRPPHPSTHLQLARDTSCNFPIGGWDPSYFQCFWFTSIWAMKQKPWLVG